MKTGYELRKGNDINGKWEVAHYWEDGVRVQVRYFRTEKEAREYLKSKGL